MNMFAFCGKGICVRWQLDIGHFRSICGTCLNKNQYVLLNCQSAQMHMCKCEAWHGPCMRTCAMCKVSMCLSCYSTSRRPIMKRSLTTFTSGTEQLAKQRKVKHERYQKWVRQYDCKCQMVMWLNCTWDGNWGRCTACDKAEVSSVHQVQGQDYRMEELQLQVNKWSGLSRLYQLSRLC